MLLQNYFVDYFAIGLTTLGKCSSISLECFFLSHVLLLPYLHLALSKLDVLGTKPVSPRVRHRVICKNYENIERQNTDDGTLLDI